MSCQYCQLYKEKEKELSSGMITLKRINMSFICSELCAEKVNEYIKSLEDKIKNFEDKLCH